MRLQRFCLLVNGLLTASSALAQSCQGFWAGTGPNIGARTMAVFDDGTGEKLYIAASNPSGVERWDGRRWEDVSQGLPVPRAQVSALLPLDLGSGPSLYVAVYRVSPFNSWSYHRWNGQEWTPDADGLLTADTAPMLQFGTVIYGLRNLGNWTNGITRWTGSGWELFAAANLGIGVFGTHDAGQGPELYVGGTFTIIGGTPANRIARWDGISWHALGTGLNSMGPRLMASHDDGSGRALYVADVQEAGGLSVNRIAKWDGQQWSDVGGGGISSIPITTLHILASFDDGTGPALITGGYMTYTGTGIPLRAIARFKGGVWDDMAGGLRGGIPMATAVYDDGRGPSLFIGGEFHSAGAGAPWGAPHVVQWVSCHNQCYADCDNSQVSPRLNIDDFTCFIRKYAYGDPYVDCDGDRQRTIADFHCFMNRFAENCR